MSEILSLESASSGLVEESLLLVGLFADRSVTESLVLLLEVLSVAACSVLGAAVSILLRAIDFAERAVKGVSLVPLLIVVSSSGEVSMLLTGELEALFGDVTIM